MRIRELNQEQNAYDRKYLYYLATVLPIVIRDYKDAQFFPYAFTAFFAAKAANIISNVIVKKINGESFQKPKNLVLDLVLNTVGPLYSFICNNKLHNMLDGGLMFFMIESVPMRFSGDLDKVNLYSSHNIINSSFTFPLLFASIYSIAQCAIITGLDCLAKYMVSKLTTNATHMRVD